MQKLQKGPWSMHQRKTVCEKRLGFSRCKSWHTICDTAENVIKKQTAELAEAEPKEAESPNSGAKMEEPRPKRTITKPPYLQDFVE